MNTLNLGIVATIVSQGINYRVTDHGSDYEVCCADGTNYRWFSTHQALTPRVDIALALSSYLGTKVLQENINYI